MTKLKIDNRDLNFTIDTYNMFNGSGSEESEREYYQDKYGLTDDEVNDLDFDYCPKKVVRDLSKESINILENELKGLVVKSIDLVECGSPQFYNYTTDNYVATWDIDLAKLEEYIKENQEQYNEFEQEHWHWLHIDHGTKDFNQDDYNVACLDFYTSSELDEDDYNSRMWEFEHQAWGQNMCLSPESQEMIDAKRVVK